MSETNITDQPQGLPKEKKPSFKERGSNFLALFIPVEGYFITPVIVNLNILVFIVMALTGVSIIEPDTASLINWGANYRPITLEGQWWRLFTCCFLHIGILHLALNMYALISIGVLLEPIMKKSNFLIAYILTGVAASANSLWWHDNTVSAGASGAIFGMYGVFLAMLTTNLIDKAERQNQLRSILIFVGYNLMFGMKGGVDNAAHIGGLLSGIFTGYCFYFILKNPGSSTLKNSLIAACTGVILIFATYIYSTASNDIGLYTKKMEAFSQKETQALEIYTLKNLENADLLDKISSGIKLWKENSVIIDSIEKLDIPEVLKSRNELLKEYCLERIHSFELNYKMIKENSNAYATEITESDKNINDIIKQIDSH